MHIDNALADAFTREFAARHHVLIVNKADRPEAKLVAAGIEFARTFNKNLPTAEEFMQNYSTTIAVDHLAIVYIAPGMPPESRIEVVTHEMEHVFQARRGEFKNHVGLDGHKLGGGFEMIGLYLFADTEARCRYESIAYRAGLEIGHLAMKRPMPDVDSMVQPLEGGYALSEGAKTLARDLAESNIVSVGFGIALTEAGREGMSILENLTRAR